MNMNRYNILFRISDNQYIESSPVIIVAGALLRDNVDNKNLVQLKLKNIDNKKIIALKVHIDLYDENGLILKDCVKYEYLGLDECRDQEFGEQIPIIVSNNSRKITVSVLEVLFDDYSQWCSYDQEWTSIGKQKPIDSVMQSNELKEQYFIEFGKEAEFLVNYQKDLWLCACGGINHMWEEQCHICQKTPTYYKSYDVDNLLDKAKKRIDEKKYYKRKKKKQFLLVIGLIGGIILLGIVGKYAYKNIIVPNTIYHNAKQLYEADNYEEAIEKFTSLGEYRDAHKWVNRCYSKIEESENQKIYNDAMDKLKLGDYDGAIRALESLDDFSDSKSQLQIAKQKKYNMAIDRLNKTDYDSHYKAYEIFGELGDFKDSEEKKEEATQLCFIELFYDDVKEAHNYFTDRWNEGKYNIMPTDDLKKILVDNKWNAYSYGTKSDIIFYTDGTIKRDTKAGTWSTKGDKLIINDLWETEYYAVQLNEECILLYMITSRGYVTPSEMLIKR